MGTYTFAKSVRPQSHFRVSPFPELGKVDEGGGGTIAYIMANYGMEVIDSGVAVLSMHDAELLFSNASENIGSYAALTSEDSILEFCSALLTFNSDSLPDRAIRDRTSRQSKGLRD